VKNLAGSAFCSPLLAALTPLWAPKRRHACNFNPVFLIKDVLEQIMHFRERKKRNSTRVSGLKALLDFGPIAVRLCMPKWATGHVTQARGCLHSSIYSCFVFVLWHASIGDVIWAVWFVRVYLFVHVGLQWRDSPIPLWGSFTNYLIKNIGIVRELRGGIMWPHLGINIGHPWLLPCSSPPAASLSHPCLLRSYITI